MTTALKPEIAALVSSAASKWGLDEYVLAAQVIQESSGNPLAMRFEPTFRWLHGPAEDPVERRWQMTSWGLLQVMGATARDLGFTDPPFADPAAAVPVIWLDLGVRYLVRKLHVYGGRIAEALSAYNSGHSTPNNFGSYVEPILERADALREAAG